MVAMGKKLNQFARRLCLFGLLSSYYLCVADDGAIQDNVSRSYQQAKALFSKHVNKVFGPQWQDNWHQLGYRYYQDGGLWHIEAIDDAAMLGGGHYIFNPHAQKYHLVQAPHRYFDKKTRPIALKLFASPNVFSVSWNTEHRRTIDFSHVEVSMMMALTDAWLESIPKGDLIQLHGFTPLKRTTEAGKRSMIIVSEGINTPSAGHKALTACFNSVWQAALYPMDVSELGGTTNKMARKMASQPNHRFVHIELSTAFREQLIKDAVDNTQFISCIDKVLDE